MKLSDFRDVGEDDSRLPDMTRNCHSSCRDENFDHWVIELVTLPIKRCITIELRDLFADWVKRTGVADVVEISVKDIRAR